MNYLWASSEGFFFGKNAEKKLAVAFEPSELPLEKTYLLLDIQSFEKTVPKPQVPEKEVPGVLAFELERLYPSSANQLDFVFHKEKEQIKLYIYKKEDFFNLYQRLPEALRSKIKKISLANQPEVLLKNPGRTHSPSSIWLVLMIFLLSMSIVIFGLYTWQAHSHLSDLEKEQLHLKGSIDPVQVDILNQWQIRKDQVSITPIFYVVTEKLPEAAYITEFFEKNGRYEVTGKIKNENAMFDYITKINNAIEHQKAELVLSEKDRTSTYIEFKIEIKSK